MSACEKCWREAGAIYWQGRGRGDSQVAVYHELLDQRADDPCTPEQQADVSRLPEWMQAAALGQSLEPVARVAVGGVWSLLAEAVEAARQQGREDGVAESIKAVNMRWPGSWHAAETARILTAWLAHGGTA